ncbi:MAG TPA: hypothetical protein VK789_21165 [Bryobacteraceae bacterium]|jgi:hypothetical protein|nr:hypothetical protein [Bryobacteraceae bacterium]
MLTKVTAVCLLALGLSRPVFSQTNPDIQKVLDRLDTLEAENRKLLDEIHELRNELIERNTEGLDVQENRTAELDQSKVGTSQKLPITLTGMLLFNAFDNGKHSGTAQDPTSAALNAAPAFSGASLRQTVLGLKFNGPDLPGGGKASGQFYMDFFAGTSSPLNNLLRIRIATVDLNWKNFTLTLGQDKPIISPREPTSLAQVGVSPLTGAGNLWDWAPQVRLQQRFSFGENTGLLAQAGVYQTAESYPGTQPVEYSGTLERVRPGYQGRFEFFHGSENRRIEIAPGFHFSTTHVARQSVPSQIVSLDWLFRPTSVFEFTGEFFHGQNVAGLGARQGFDILPSEMVVPVHSQGEWAQISVFAAARLSFHAYAGEQHDRASDVAPGGVTRNFVYAGNLMYKLAPNVVAAFEASQARTQYLGSLLRLNNHYDLALAYLF